ncbi:nicotinamide N-methyltransferase-like [Gastrophryne carolinensis]
MDCCDVKYYHIHDICSRSMIDTYFCAGSVFSDEALTIPMEKLHEEFEKDHIHGDLCIDFSVAPIIHHLISASGCFKQIILMRVTNSCIFEINRWLHDRTGAFCWKHASSFVAEKQGNSELCDHKEMQLKDVIKCVMKCNLEEENIVAPMETPQGDCVMSLWLLDNISTSQNDYLMKLRKMLECLKPGGRFIQIGSLNTTYYMNNGEKMHVFKYNKEFACSAVIGEKLIIDRCEVVPRKVKSDLSDIEASIFISAHKEN